MRSMSRLALVLALGTATPGCFFGNIQHDVDRTPVMDAGAGASILMPGESAPMVVPGAAAPGASGTVATPGASPDPGSATQGSRVQSGAPAGSAGPPISMLGGTHVDEERHLSAREEPIWWKYLTLPFAVVAAPFKLAADSASSPEEAGPALPEQAPAPPATAPAPPRLDYESVRMQQLEQELDRRGASEPSPAPRATAQLSIADELAALQRVPSAARSGSAPAPAGSRDAQRPLAPASPSSQSSLVPSSPADGIVDRNGDGRIDQWIYREDGAIARRVLDDDFDGRAERSFVYDRATQQVVRVEEDSDQDGTVDAWSEYQGGQIQRRRADSDHDGAVDTWILYRDGQTLRHEQDTTGDGFRDRVGFYRDGRLESDEVDTNGDGRSDLFNHYDDREQVVRRDEDTNFDGKVDRVSHFESGKLARREIIDAGSH
jgi:hypothetical protein